MNEPSQPVSAAEVLSHLWGWLVGGGIAVMGTLLGALKWFVKTEVAAQLDQHKGALTSKLEEHEKDEHAHSNLIRLDRIEQKLDEIRELLVAVQVRLAAATGQSTGAT